LAHPVRTPFPYTTLFRSRRQVEAEIEAAARGEPTYKEALRRAGPIGRAAGDALPASAPTEGDDLSMALWVIADSDATNEEFTAADRKSTRLNSSHLGISY